MNHAFALGEKISGVRPRIDEGLFALCLTALILLRASIGRIGTGLADALRHRTA